MLQESQENINPNCDYLLDKSCHDAFAIPARMTGRADPKPLIRKALQMCYSVAHQTSPQCNKLSVILILRISKSFNFIDIFGIFCLY